MLCLFIGSIANAQFTENYITNLDRPFSLAKKGNDLYMSEFTANKITKFDLTNLTETTVVDQGLSQPSKILFDGDILYIAEYDTGEISKINITDANPVAETIITGLNEPADFVIKDNVMYIAEYSGNRISKVNLSDGLFNVELFRSLTDPFGITVDNDNFYFANIASGGNVYKYNETTDTQTLLTSNVTAPHNLTIVENTMYVSEYSLDGNLKKVNLIDGSTTVELSGLQQAAGLLVDNNTMYIAQYFTNKISKYDLPSLNIAEYESINFNLYLNDSTLQINTEENLTNAEIFDALGKSIKKVYSKSVNIEDLSSGIYLLKIKTQNDKTAVKRFIKY